MFDPVTGAQEIKEAFVDYVTTRFDMADVGYAKAFRTALLEEGAVTKGPYIDIGGAFEPGASLQSMVAQGRASELFQSLEPVSEDDRELKLERPLYWHQEQALHKARNGRNLVVTTGTGSGKTECFLLPILDALLEEEQSGTLDCGVRAIVIYPMNALANDQMKRMRKLVQGHPNITFGLYNGKTKHTQQEALADYRSTVKDDDGNAMPPLPNELISREQMQETPPHILITNYSMLEYMLLRPNDDKVFSEAKLRYIVLDEAHIYKGATGMEAALLMRRLRARISEPGKAQYILTSATLGGLEANREILSFAKSLCGAEFEEADIIRSKEKKAEMQDFVVYPLAIYHELLEHPSAVGDILSRHQADFCPNGSTEAKLYQFFLHNDLFAMVRRHLKTPMTISDLLGKLRDSYAIDTQTFIDFISVCAKAKQDGAPLIRPRYHFFVRALEGLYVGMGDSKEVFLQRKTVIPMNGEEKAIFEAAVCSDCGRMALVGKIEGGYLCQTNRFDAYADFFVVKDSADDSLLEDEEEDAAETQQDYVLCPICGAIATGADSRLGGMCDHDASQYIQLKKAQITGSEGQFKNVRCPACGFGRISQGYLGADAATAVLGTRLFELLPDEEVEVKTIEHAEKTGSMFDLEPIVEQKIRRTIMPQFLCFSDSRSEAAFFASYMEKSYQEFLRRRGIWHVVEKLKSRGKCTVAMDEFVGELTRYFEVNKSFAKWKPDGKQSEGDISRDARSNAWVAVLNEMFNARRSTSLVSMGLFSFEFLMNARMSKGAAVEWNIPEQEALALLDLLSMDIVYSGAIAPSDGEQLTSAERGYIFYAETEKKMVLLKEGALAKKNWITGWRPRERGNGNYYTNSRISRLGRDLGMTPPAVDVWLGKYWEKIIIPMGLCEGKEGGVALRADHFQIRLGGTEGSRFYRCQKCGRLTPYSVKGHCSHVKCSGTLVPCNPLEENLHDHYAKLYRSQRMTPFYIKEHTAQLSKEHQTEYQNAFTHKEIHALSCSTTFEMGVDLGDLETVYMRDVPPSPANYVQRAGRAGRGKNAGAFVLTYAKLSSHDFTYFQRPLDMIRGTIQVPAFEVTNEKIIRRHIYAVALSSFFNIHPELYDGNNQYLFLNQGGYEVLQGYLTPVSKELTILLKASIPAQLHEKMGITDGSWVDMLCGKKGTLQLAVDAFRGTVAMMQEEQEKAFVAKDFGAINQWGRALARFRCAPEDKMGKKQIINFLVRSNVLPSYGFPVDVVELSPHPTYSASDKDNRVSLSRDLQLAIADYAPGAQVVADGKLYTSRYLQKMPGATSDTAWEEGSYCEACPACDHPNFLKEAKKLMPDAGRPCVSCQATIGKRYWQETIEPRMGFCAEPKTKDVPMRRPEREFKSDDYYVGDPYRNVIGSHWFDVDGQRLQVESTDNDTLVVVGDAPFEICPVCGYASIEPIKKHDTPQGHTCLNTGRDKKSSRKIYHLSHDFKTDVVKLSFFTSAAKDRSTMLSVLYALLEGLSQEMGIERNDLKGCLFWTKLGTTMGYALVLYDGVAGGAGHVRRMVSEDGAPLHRTLVRALRKLESCNCDTSCYQCLRNYFNQKIHDDLHRHRAITFLKEWVGEYTPLDVEGNPIKPCDNYDEVKVEVISYDNMEDTTWTSFAQRYEIELHGWDDVAIPMMCLAWPTLQVESQNIEPCLIWERQKVVVFQTEEECVDSGLAQCGWTTFPITVAPDELAKRLRGD